MQIKDSSTCESPPDALKQRTEALARHIGEAMEGGSGFVFGVLYDENHCADIGGINGVNKEVVARLRSSFTRMFIQSPDIASIIKEALALVLMDALESHLHDELTNKSIN